ncbi:hypothetical protein [Actinospica robiniae]|uniref:hypothetical protein n=1 Tax=Actinospica robiniae TaxID=304901 RepID=UPI0012F716BE|nr:hypothetical protein [Actinospica robiniae]
MSPEFGRDELIDWPSVEAAWGVGFPRDYKRFLRHYGVGSFNDSLHVFAPAGPDRAAVAAATEGLAGGLAWLREHSRGGSGTPPYPAYPARPGLIRWGTSIAGDDAFWLVDVADPDAWPIVIWDRGMTEWITRPPGMTELLLQVLTAPVDDQAMSMIGSAPGRPVRFVNEQIVNTLQDPWPDLLD